MATTRRGRPPHPDVLTPAEWSVLELWRHGLGRSHIASRRGISVYAVRYHLRNIAGKLGVEHYAELRHWPGLSAASRNSRGVSRMNTQQPLLGPIVQVALLTRDIARAEAWYRDVLRLAHLFTFGDLAFFDCDGTRLFIRQVHGREEWAKGSIVYFLVDDIGAAYETLRAAGISFHGAPHMIYRDDATGIEEWFAFFDDPDGNTLSITSRAAAATPER